MYKEKLKSEKKLFPDAANFLNVTSVCREKMEIGGNFSNRPLTPHSFFFFTSAVIVVS